jgi:hypothetical protein
MTITLNDIKTLLVNLPDDQRTDTEAAILRRLEEQDPPVLEPGVYSLFVLVDDGTWTQPIYRVTVPVEERVFRQEVEAQHGGFISYGVQEDLEAPPEAIRGEFLRHRHNFRAEPAPRANAERHIRGAFIIRRLAPHPAVVARFQTDGRDRAEEWFHKRGLAPRYNR